MNGSNLWLGSEASFEEFQSLMQTIATLQASTDPVILQARSSYDGEEDSPHMLTMQGSIGIININGMITNRDDWIAKYLGLTTYNGIREALVTAAEDKYCDVVVLNIASPGGMVAGVDDVAKLVTIVDKIKPVYTYASGNMASAAYWLGVGARERYAGATSVVGSIGTMAKHREISKMLAIDGVTDTNIRGGRYKALAQDNEPLSPEAKQIIQAQVDHLYSIFLDHVSSQLGKSSTVVHEIAADGREFIGKQAVEVGLINGVMTYDQFISMITSKVLDNGKASSNTANKSNRTNDNGDQTMTKRALTDQAAAILAAGGTVASGDEAQAAAATTEAGDAGTQAPAAEVTAAAAGSTELVAYLKEQVATLTSQLTAANAELVVAKGGNTVTAELDGLKAIAVAACNNMQIALGGSALDLSALQPAQLIAKHDELKTSFTGKFKANGVAAVDAVESESDKKPKFDAQFAMRVEAAGGKVQSKKA